MNDRPQNNLNPVWRQITLLEQELPSEERKLRIEVYDDDGKLGPDASDHLIGEGYYSVEDMGICLKFIDISYNFWYSEQAFTARTPLPIHKRDNVRGHLIFTQVHKSMSAPPPSTYPAPKRPSTASPYPLPTGLYPPTPEANQEENHQSQKISDDSSQSSLQTAPYSAGGFVIPGRN